MKQKKETKGTDMVPIQAQVLTTNKAWIAKIKERGSQLLEQAQALVIKDDSARTQAAELRMQTKVLVKDVDEKFDKARDTAYKIYTLVKDAIATMKANPLMTVKILDEGMSDFDLEKERIARIEREKAEIEKNRLDKIEADKLLARAAKAEEKGKDEKAEILREQAAAVNNFVPSAAGPDKTFRTESGTTSGTRDFSVVILDKMAIIRQLAAGSIAPGVIGEGKNPEGQTIELKISNSALKKYAEMHMVSDTLPNIPGLKLISKISYGSRAAGSGK